MGFKLSHGVLRLVTGAFILNSGVSKLSLDDDGAARLQDMTAHAIPQAKQVSPKMFGKMIAGAEVALGAALLAPFVPTRLAALGLTAFSSGLLAVYAKTPGLTQSDGIRPTPAGVPMAKDAWLAGIGVALLIDRKHHPVKARRKVAQAKAAQAKTAIKSAVK